MKRHPYCAEQIQDKAIICRYCDSNLSEPHQEGAKEEGHTVRFVPGPKWGRIGLAVLLAGMVPAELSNSVVILGQLAGVYQSLRPVHLMFHFAIHLLPLPLGIWASMAWPGRHPRGHAMLGLLAGFVEAPTTRPQPPGPTDDEWTRDLIKALGPAALALLGTTITAAVTLAQQP